MGTGFIDHYTIFHLAVNICLQKVIHTGPSVGQAQNTKDVVL